VGFYLIGVTIMEMAESSGDVDLAHSVMIGISALVYIIPLAIGLYLILLGWRRKAIPRRYAAINLITLPCAVVMTFLMWNSCVPQAFSKILWGVLIVLLGNMFALVWVPWVLYRQRHR